MLRQGTDAERNAGGQHDDAADSARDQPTPPMKRLVREARVSFFPARLLKFGGHSGTSCAKRWKPEAPGLSSHVTAFAASMANGFVQPLRRGNRQLINWKLTTGNCYSASTQ